MNHHTIVLLLSLFFLTTACGSNENQENECRSQPTPIFKGIERFENHHFEANGQNSKETVLVPPLAMDLELYQSGCQSLTQEYRFVLHGTMPKQMKANQCAGEIASIFLSLSQFDAKLFEFQQWATAIQNNASAFKYNEEIPLQGSGVTVKIIKQHQPKRTILTVIFSQ